MSESKYRIALLLNWKNRDMRGILQLKICLENMGSDVRVVTHADRPLWNFYRFRPHLIVFPQVVGEVKMVKLARKMGSLIAVLHSEGTTSDRGVQSFFYKKDVNIGEVVDLEMVWGPELKKIFLENTTLSENQIHVVGCPRFDIYCPNLNKLLMRKVDFCQKYGIAPQRKLAVWASNFVNLERSERDIKHTQSFVPYDIKPEIIFQLRLREKCIEAYLQLAKENPEINFMIKLHPLEVEDYYLQKLSQLKVTNITLFKDEDIANVINACDLLLHTSSTSATEAGFLGKPTICMMLEPDYKENLADLNWGSDIVEDYASLYSKVRFYLYEHGEISKELKRNRQLFNDKWFYRIDGESTMRTAKVINSYLQGVEPPRVTRAITDELKNELIIGQNPLMKLAGKILNVVRNRKPSYWSKIRKTQVPSRKEIRDLENELRNYFTTNKSIGKDIACT